MNLRFTIFTSICFFNFLSAQTQYLSGRLISLPPSPPSANSISSVCDTVFSFPTYGTWPGGLAFDGSCFWLADGNASTLDRYDMAGNYLSSISIPIAINQGGDVDYDGNYLWHVKEQAHTLYKLDTLGNIISQFNLPTSDTLDPNNWGCAYENGYIWTTEYVDRTLMRIDCISGLLIDSFYIGRWVLPLKIIDGELYGIGLSPTLASTLYHFDKSTGAIIDSADWCLDYSIGLCKAFENIWGLSSEALGIGQRRVFRFNNVISAGIVNDNIENTASIFPNPVNSELNIVVNKENYTGEHLFVVYDIWNRELFRFKFLDLRASYRTDNLRAGIYVYELWNDNNILLKGKFVKQ